MSTVTSIRVNVYCQFEIYQDYQYLKRHIHICFLGLLLQITTNWWLETLEIHSAILEVRIQKSQGPLPPKALGEIPFFAFFQFLIDSVISCLVAQIRMMRGRNYYLLKSSIFQDMGKGLVLFKFEISSRHQMEMLNTKSDVCIWRTEKTPDARINFEL